jgi:hypothetical protein
MVTSREAIPRSTTVRAGANGDWFESAAICLSAEVRCHIESEQIVGHTDDSRSSAAWPIRPLSRGNAERPAFSPLAMRSRTAT